MMDMKDNKNQGNLFCFHTSQVGKENVHTALSLVGYDKELEAAMKFAFGSAFVAKDLNIAKKVRK